MSRYPAISFVIAGFLRQCVLFHGRLTMGEGAHGYPVGLMVPRNQGMYKFQSEISVMSKWNYRSNPHLCPVSRRVSIVSFAQKCEGHGDLEKEKE
jgi:hypothetical protein